VPVTRSIDPEVAHHRSRKAVATRDGRIADAEQAGQDLDRAKRIAAIKAAVKNAPPLEPAVRDSIVGMLYAAGGAA
jgi:hypothetical protein